MLLLPNTTITSNPLHPTPPQNSLEQKAPNNRIQELFPNLITTSNCPPSTNDNGQRWVERAIEYISPTLPTNLSKSSSLGKCYGQETKHLEG